MFQRLGFCIHSVRAAFHRSCILHICSLGFHSGCLCTLVSSILLCEKARLCTSVAALLHHLAHRLQSYCSVQNGSSLLSALGDDRGGRASLPLTTLVPFGSVPAARAATASDTGLLGCLTWARSWCLLPGSSLVIFDILIEVAVYFLGKLDVEVRPR